jgi:hypothetical protein
MLASNFTLVLCELGLVLSLLTVWFFLRRWWRLRLPASQLERQWSGHGIAAERMLRRLTRVRQDHLGMRTPPSTGQATRRQTLLCSARDALLHLAYFRRREGADHRAEAEPADRWNWN